MLNFPKWKVLMILAVVFLGILTSVPNFLSEEQRASLPDYMPSKALSLGLDLRGGVYILFEAKTEDVVKARLTKLADEVRAVRSAERGLSFRRIKTNNNSVVFDVANDDMIELAKQKLRPLTQAQIGTSPLGGGVQEVTMENDGASFRLTLTEQGVIAQQRDAIARSIEVIRKRVDPEGVKEITLKPQGNNRIILEVPGADDPKAIIDLVGKTAKLSFHDVATNISATDIEAGRIRSNQKILPMKDGGSIVVFEREIVAGDDLTNAAPAFDDRGQPAVSFAFNTSGSKRFAKHTQDNIGRPFAIVLDDLVISAPRIVSPILGGSGQITNMGDITAAQELATLLKSGALPVKLQVERQKTVGADIGADGVAAGKLASMIGFIAVIVYMVVSYGRFGLAANVALITNLILIMGALSLFQATLTLPGIAGIVLTIGMAVDANVLVFERIREEQTMGKNPFQSMEQGYGQAFSTIIDANITTFIAAAVLYLLGSGPVQGFAVTLAVGILTSMFTAIVLTRFILSLWLKRTRPARLPI
ncbi:protein translocase subunit SecD [Kordiimonas laminariae]|uniref:protein translocase subunit SecD n=1 Tax=Kordiimonas laminariae TaxID=2917717 RepID=UPI001FF3BD96|nr:protein translocase subunit SecD [Kordiimonas laminariae]MCK0070538.1 protein translocase subunit SecD [Kordiimonas laminariae]